METPKAMSFWTKQLTIIILVLTASQSAFSQTDKVDLFIKNKMKEKKIVGLQLAIIKNNKIVMTGNYGLANVQDSVPVDVNTVFPINSMTKAFTGVAVMQLVEEGKINLQYPVSAYLDSLPATWQNVTIQQIASHISGIPNIFDDEANMIAGSYEASWEKVKVLPNDFKPGEQFSYNQTNYLLLGKIIEKVSGMSFQDYISKNQFEKTGMLNTTKAGFCDFYDVAKHSARCYTYFRNDNLTNLYEVFPSNVRTAAGMYSTAKEIAQWVIALQGKQLLKKEEMLTTLWTPAILNNGKTSGFGDILNGYAIGWLTVTRPKLPAYASVGGGRSALFIYPKENLSIIVLTNLQGATPEDFIDDIANLYINGNK